MILETSAYDLQTDSQNLQAATLRLRHVQALEAKGRNDRGGASEPTPLPPLRLPRRERPPVRHGLPQAGTDPKHGTWGYYLSHGTDPKTGQRRQFRKAGLATKREALSALAELRLAGHGTYVKPTALTLGAYAVEWLPRRQRPAGAEADHGEQLPALHRGRHRAVRAGRDAADRHSPPPRQRLHGRAGQGRARSGHGAAHPGAAANHPGHRGP